MITCVLVGPFADPKNLASWAHEEFRKSAVVAFIAVDSGFEPLKKSGLPITLVIGDLDGPSGKKREREVARDGIALLKLRVDKDRSDLAVALEYCAELGSKMIYAVGFQGGRFDHDFAVHLDLSEASARIPRVVSIGRAGEAYYLSARYSPLMLKAPKSHRSKTLAKVVSVFPVGGEAKGVRLRGLRFQPPNGILSLSSQGLSNEVRSGKISIGLKRGRLVILFPA